MKISAQILNPIPVFLVLFLFLSINIVAQEEKVDTLNLSISSDLLGNVNRTDAQVSIDGVLTEILEKYNYSTTRIDLEIVDSIEEIKNSVKQNKMDIIGIKSLDYLKLKNEIEITPIFTNQESSYYGLSYVIVVKNNSGIKSLADLSSKKIQSLNVFDKDIVDMWLFVEMKKEKVLNPLEILNSFTKTLPPNKRIFSVFFNKSDGCIVDKEQFESACELNPQLGKNLKVIYESPLFLNNVFCSNNNSKKNSLTKVKGFIGDFNKEVNGSKMLKLFRAFKILDYKDEYLETLENLFENFERLLAIDNDKVKRGEE